MELFKSRTRVAYTNAVGDKVYPVIVDIKRGIKSTEEIQFMSSDINTGILSVAFIQGNDNYNVSGAEVVCSVMRPDASTLDIPCTIVENNIVEVPLGINGTSQDGIYSFDFKVFKGGNKVVGTPIMNYSVSLSISNDNAVLEDDRLPVLTMLMTQITALKNETTSVISTANTAIQNANKATDNTNLAISNAQSATQKAEEVVTRVNNAIASGTQDLEVKEARDGEVSLKARLDRDIEKTNKELDKIKKLEESTVSTIETESDFTTVEATSNGYFEDVKLEGKTLVNLCKTPNKVLTNTTEGRNLHFNASMFKYDTDYTAIFEVGSVVDGTSTLHIQWRDANNGSRFNIINNVINDISGKYIIYKFKQPSIDIPLSEVFLSINVANPSTCSCEIKNCIILEGDHTQNPPSYFEGLKSVGQSASEDGVDEIVVSSVNPYGNLFDGELEVGSLNASGDTDWTSYVKTGLIRVKPSSEVICKIGKYKGENATSTDIRMAEYDMNKNFIKFSGGTYKATVSDKTHYVKFTKKLETSDDSRVDINAVSDVVVVYGNKLHDIPHQSDKKHLLYYNEETQMWEKPILREWDSMEKHANGKYYYHQRSGEVVLNGSEDWKQSSDTQEGFARFALWLNDMKVLSDGVNNIFTWISGVTFANSTNNETIGSHINSTNLYVNILGNRLSTQDVQGFKAWLQANNVTVVYQLAQEKVYECTNIDLITYANETNYMVESGAIAPKSILKVHNNISNVVKILQEKVSLLENKFIEGLKQVLAGDMYSLAELLYPEDFEEVGTENNIMLLPLE